MIILVTLLLGTMVTELICSLFLSHKIIGGVGGGQSLLGEIVDMPSFSYSLHPFLDSWV